MSPEPARSHEFSYEQRFGELRELQAVPNRVAPVTQLVLKRDAGQFTFGDGKFYLLTPKGFQMYVPVTLDLGNDRVARVRVKVRGSTSEIDLPLMPSKPKAVRFNDLDGVLAEVKMVDWRE